MPTAIPLPRPLARRAALCAALALAHLPATGADPACPGIHVTVLNIRNSAGSIACALFESAPGLPNDFPRTATRVMVMKIRDTHARCDFVDIPPGTFALAVILDENMNGELDANWLESRRKATASRTTPGRCSVRLHSTPRVFPTTGATWN